MMMRNDYEREVVWGGERLGDLYSEIVLIDSNKRCNSVILSADVSPSATRETLKFLTQLSGR